MNKIFKIFKNKMLKYSWKLKKGNKQFRKLNNQK